MLLGKLLVLIVYLFLFFFFLGTGTLGRTLATCTSLLTSMQRSLESSLSQSNYTCFLSVTSDSVLPIPTYIPLHFQAESPVVTVSYPVVALLGAPVCEPFL